MFLFIYIKLLEIYRFELFFMEKSKLLIFFASDVPLTLLEELDFVDTKIYLLKMCALSLIHSKINVILEANVCEYLRFMKLN